MKISNYFYIAHSNRYGMLRGMYLSDCLDSLTLEDAREIAYCQAYDVVISYDCILESIHEDLNEFFGYNETPANPNEEYLDALEEAIWEECVYALWEITPEGESHWDEMEADPESYEDYLKKEWIKSCE